MRECRCGVDIRAAGQVEPQKVADMLQAKGVPNHVHPVANERLQVFVERHQGARACIVLRDHRLHPAAQRMHALQEDVLDHRSAALHPKVGAIDVLVAALHDVHQLPHYLTQPHNRRRQAIARVEGSAVTLWGTCCAVDRQRGWDEVN